RAEARLGRHVVFVFRRCRGWFRSGRAVPISVAVTAAVAASPATAGRRAASAAIPVAEAASAAPTARSSFFSAAGHARVERLVQVDCREVDAALAVHFDDAHRDLIAELDGLFRPADRRGAQMADVDQSLLARQNLHERAHADQAGDFARVDAPDLDLGNHVEDHVGGALAGFLIDSSDEDLAVLLDVDLRARL